MHNPFSKPTHLLWVSYEYVDPVMFVALLHPCPLPSLCKVTLVLVGLLALKARQSCESDSCPEAYPFMIFLVVRNHHTPWLWRVYEDGVLLRSFTRFDIIERAHHRNIWIYRYIRLTNFWHAVSATYLACQ